MAREISLPVMFQVLCQEGSYAAASTATSVTSPSSRNFQVLTVNCRYRAKTVHLQLLLEMLQEEVRTILLLGKVASHLMVVTCFAHTNSDAKNEERRRSQKVKAKAAKDPRVFLA